MNKDLNNILWAEHHREDAEYIRDVLQGVGYQLGVLQAEILWKWHSADTAAAGWLTPKSPEEVVVAVENILRRHYKDL